MARWLNGQMANFVSYLPIAVCIFSISDYMSASDPVKMPCGSFA
jgi:hypothetical protein